MFNFKRESWSTIKSEGSTLLRLHYSEVAHYQDIPLDPDHENYFKIEEAGALRVYTARDEEKSLIGYVVFFVKNNLHYKNSLQAYQDILFINPLHRGFGRHFISWCDGQLADEGVQVVYHHVKSKHNFGPLLERSGYELIDYIYGRRLDAVSSSPNGGV